MGIVLPRGVLFRGVAEGVIRKALLEMGQLMLLLAYLLIFFYGTSISTTVIILKKNRQNQDMLFIDASNDFEKQKNQNMFRESDIETYKTCGDVEKYAHLASFEEIGSNDFNLNIPRYGDIFEEEEPIDIVELSREQLAVIDDSCEIIETTNVFSESDMMNGENLDSQKNKLKEMKKAPELRFKGFSDNWEQQQV
jgi:type I restriction enzyme M protein